MKVLFLILGFCACLHVEAKECLAQKDVDDVLSGIQIEEWNSSSWVRSTSFELCNEEALVNTVLKSLTGLKSLPPLAALTGKMASNILGDSPFKFLADHVRTIRVDTQKHMAECQSESSRALAFVNDGFSNTLYVCPLVQQGTSLGVFAALIHEARHLLSEVEKVGVGARSGPVYAHSTCSHGLLSGSAGCDESYQVGGAYAVAVELLLKFSRTEALDSVLRQSAKSMALEQLLLHFNQLPGEMQTGAILLSNDGTVFFYDDASQGLTPLLRDVPSSTVVTLRTVPTLFSAAPMAVKSLLTPTLLVDTPGSFAKKFRTKFSDEQRLKLRDVYYGINYYCFLFSDSLSCEGGTLDAEDSVTLVLPPNIKPMQFAAFGEAPGDSDLIFIVSEDGKLYSVPRTTPVKSWLVTDLTETPSLYGFRGVGLLPGLRRIGLSWDGTLVSYDDPSVLTPIAKTKDLRFKKMMAPYYWSTGLLELLQ